MLLHFILLLLGLTNHAEEHVVVLRVVALRHPVLHLFDDLETPA